MAKIYFIGGTVWRTRKLKLPELERLKTLYSNHVQDHFKQGVSVVTILDKIITGAALPEFMKTVLAPFWFLGWWNWLIIRLHGETSVERIMGLEMIARVGDDFFVRNVKWISAYISFTNPWISNSKTLPLVGENLHIENPLFRPQTET